MNMNYRLSQVLKVSLAIFFSGLILASPKMYAKSCTQKPCQVKCLPVGQCERHVRKLIEDTPAYCTLYTTLLPFVPELTTLLQNVTNQAGYAPLYARCLEIAALLPTGRIVVCDSDGLVAVDTGKSAALNTYAHFQAGANPATFFDAINVNHNSRVAIFAAQEWVCGIGVETKFSNSVGVNQNYAAIRLGPYLNSAGTARFSENEGAVP